MTVVELEWQTGMYTAPLWQAFLAHPAGQKPIIWIPMLWAYGVAELIICFSILSWVPRTDDGAHDRVLGLATVKFVSWFGAIIGKFG